MKRISNLSMGIIIINLIAMNTVWSQILSNKDGSLIKGSTLASGSLVCQLTGPELQKRKSALQKEVFAHVKEIEEVDDGYVFHFADDDDFLLKLADYIMAEKKCCPFFKFDLSIQAYKAGIAWKVSGNSEVKAMVKMFVDDIGK